MKQYEVVQKGCLNHAVGDVIELTEKKAKCLINKVKLVEVEEKPKKKRSKKQDASE